MVSLAALRAVLATAERRGYHKVLVAGDLCFSWPRAAGKRADARSSAGDLRPRRHRQSARDDGLDPTR